MPLVYDNLNIFMFAVVALFGVCNTILQVRSHHFVIEKDRRYVSSTSVIISINMDSMVSCANLCTISTDCCSASYSNDTMMCVLSGVCYAETEPINGVNIIKNTLQQGKLF